MMSAKNKKGMTLVELLVYMALAALLLAPIIVLMTNSSRNMARDAATTDMKISGRDIMGFMYDDIKNTGFKIRMDSGKIDWERDVTYLIDRTPAVPYNQQDSSSFNLRNGTGNNAAFDTLTIRKGRLNDTSGWVGYDAITYFVDDIKTITDAAAGNTTIRMGTLKRRAVRYDYNPISGNHITPIGGGTDTLILAQNVEAVQFQADSLDPSGGYYIWLDNLPAPVAAFSTDPIPSNTAALSATNATNKRNARTKNIKVIVVLRHSTQKGTTKTYPANTLFQDGPTLQATSTMREKHEIVIPIPNNGLFP